MLQSNQLPATVPEALSAFRAHITDGESEASVPLRRHSAMILLYASRFLCALFLFICGVGCDRTSYTMDLESVVKGFQQRHAAVETVTGNFQHHYHAPAQGIEQEESGVFWFKRPDLMRWESRQPEEKLFVVDGKESFHYIPLDYQVYVQPFTEADLRNTPLELLLGSVDIYKNYEVDWELNALPKSELTFLIRLTSRLPEPGYSYLVLELDQETWDLHRLIIKETAGNISEFVFDDVKINVKIDDRKFRFKPPDGVDIVQLTDDQ
jgi:outer membrane lipoprotein carrier protein